MKPPKRANWPAREDQIAVEVACNCDGTTLVNETSVAAWSCGKCRCKARPTGNTIVLGVDGAMPADWRPEPIVEAVA